MGLRARAAPVLAGPGPVLDRAFKSNRAQGLAQLNTTAQQGFYTGTEARYFQMRILGTAREHQPAAALAAARSLANDFPDDACFARSYAIQAFAQSEFVACEQISRDIPEKLNQGQAGYEDYSGRVAAYHLGYLMHAREQDLIQAADYYRRCLVFSETMQLTTGYYVFANAALARSPAPGRRCCLPLLCGGRGKGGQARSLLSGGAGLFKPLQPTEAPLIVYARFAASTATYC